MMMDDLAVCLMSRPAWMCPRLCVYLEWKKKFHCIALRCAHNKLNNVWSIDKYASEFVEFFF